MNRLKVLLEVAKLQLEASLGYKWLAIPAITFFMFLTTPGAIAEAPQSILAIFHGFQNTISVFMAVLVICPLALWSEFSNLTSLCLSQSLKRSEYAVALWLSVMLPSALSATLIPFTIVSFVAAPSMCLEMLPCIALYTLVLLLMLTQVYSLTLIAGVFSKPSETKNLAYVFAAIAISYILIHIPLSVGLAKIYENETSIIPILVAYSIIPTTHLANAVYLKIRGLTDYAERYTGLVSHVYKPWLAKLICEHSITALIGLILFTLALFLLALTIFDKNFEVS